MASDAALFRGATGIERAHATIERMAALEIPATPANYEVWTAHLAGEQPELSREINARLARGEPFTDEFNEALHERFFANMRLSFQILETSETIARELDDVMAGLHDAGAQAGVYADELTRTAEGLEADPAPSEFRILVQRAAASTRQAVEQNRILAAQIEDSSRQISQLQTALQAVKLEALTDGLTGLANRRMFDETLHKRILECAADKSELCVLLFDIDNFRRLNDAWGREIGDQILRYAASVMRQHAQGDLLAARYGGEEFAMIMPRTGLVLAEALAARINRAIKSKQISRKSTGDVIGALTVSAGVVRFRPPESAGDLVSRAEACVAAAKDAGRDCIRTDAQLQRLSAA